MAATQKHEIQICMGSSCFSRGNNGNLQVIQQFLRDHNLEESVKVVGNLCVGECSTGPNLRIDGRLYREVNREICLNLLKTLLTEDA